MVQEKMRVLQVPIRVKPDAEPELAIVLLK